MKANRLLICCILTSAVVAIGTPLRAETFSAEMSFDGDYQTFLHNTVNAVVGVDSSFGVTFWRPSSAGVNAEVVYRFPVGFEIREATLYAEIASFGQFDPSATAYLDISTDGVNWTELINRTILNNQASSFLAVDGSITPYVQGADEVWIRSRLYAAGGGIFAQFMRTIPNAEEFRGIRLHTIAVPEPTTLTLLSSVALAGLYCYRRRQSYG